MNNVDEITQSKNHKTVLNNFHECGYKTKIDFWEPHALMQKNMMEFSSEKKRLRKTTLCKNDCG